MRGLLIRVGADQSAGGGSWNGPVDSRTGEFVYVAIPESSPTHPGLNKPYAALHALLGGHGIVLPGHLTAQDMHLDPDFDHLTYGDQGERAKQIGAKLGPDDLIVFFAGMRDVLPAPQLVYAIIGIYFIEQITPAARVAAGNWHENAHTRRVLPAGAMDIVVRARAGVSGRLKRCIPVGDYRRRAYRVWPHLLTAWGGLSVRDGYLQRSARLPEFIDAARFYRWFLSQNVPILQTNN